MNATNEIEAICLVRDRIEDYSYKHAFAPEEIACKEEQGTLSRFVDRVFGFLAVGFTSDRVEQF